MDPPIRPDPLGNAIIGGVVSGVAKGAVTARAGSISDALKAGAAPGALSTARGATVGGTTQVLKDAIEMSNEQNLKSGRGGPDDPRYNPARLFKR